MEEKYVMIPIRELEGIMFQKAKCFVLAKVINVVPSYSREDVFKAIFPDEQKEAETSENAEV